MSNNSTKFETVCNFASTAGAALSAATCFSVIFFSCGSAINRQYKELDDKKISVKTFNSLDLPTLPRVLAVSAASGWFCYDITKELAFGSCNAALEFTTKTLGALSDYHNDHH